MTDVAATAGARAPLVYATVLYWQPVEVPLVERCVESLVAQEPGGAAQLRVLVLDNGCGATPSLPPRGRVSSELVRLPTHLGFTGGHNAGMRRALVEGADYVFLVNSDIVAERTCLSELLRVAEADPRVGIVGPLVLREAEPDRVESAGQSFHRRTGRHRELGRGMDRGRVGLEPRQVDAVSGCALLAKRDVLTSIGLLDDRLFCYFEDMDWCLRARRQGFGVAVAPRARVWHRGGGSTGPAAPRTTFYSVRNHLVVAGRYARRPVGRLVYPLVLAYHVAFLLRSQKRRSPAHARALVCAAWAALRGRLSA